MKQKWGAIIAGAGAVGLLIATYNYFSPVGLLSPLSNTSGSLGGLVPVASSIILIIAGVILAHGERSSWLVKLFAVLAIIDIVGTGFAAILLDSNPLLLTMVVAAAGWLLWVVRGTASGEGAAQ